VFPVSRSVSIGALYWQSDMCFSTALRLVDECQREAKKQGGNRCFYATDEDHKALRERTRNTSESRIRMGLTDGEFRYHVQPIYCSSQKDHSLVGFEMLLRWCQSARKVLRPPDFVSSFDQLFFSEEFTEIRQSMREAALNALPLHKGLYVSWNFSAQQLVHADFVEGIVREFSELRRKVPFTCVIEVAEQGLTARIDEKN
jgi:EAL domain-containing protein (putative c-di-GMP-specific phosphodiesterase class I)